MSHSASSMDSRSAGSSPGTNWAVSILSSPIIWGTALTVTFYALIPVMPIQREVMQRYFCSHWILYATTWLFGIGIAILAGKSMILPRQQAAFAYQPLRNAAIANESDWLRKLELINQNIAALPARVRDSELMRRFNDVCEYLLVRRSSATLEDHLKYLHEVAGEKLHDSYALIRTITWAIPILGFLGTVIGITMAIANITPDQLEQSMSEITGGLAVAFDTTALSLSLSMILVFVSFVVERSEQNILGRVEEVGMHDIAPALTNAAEQAEPVSPLLAAENQAAAELLQKTEQLVVWQTNLWQESLDRLRGRWEQVVQRQQNEFAKQIQAGMNATLNQHNQELVQSRHELSETFTRLSGDLVKLVSEVQDRSQQQQATAAAELASLWNSVQTEMHALREEQGRQVETLVRTFSNEVHEWQADLRTATQASAGQVRELHSQGETLLKIVGEEAELSRLQHTLATNLDAIRAVETFEKALHTLTAAVHMMTIKNRAA